MSELTFLLPDVGEGLTEAEIVNWRVAPGDAVAVNDVLVEIETAKSLVELPPPLLRRRRVAPRRGGPDHRCGNAHHHRDLGDGCGAFSRAGCRRDGR